MSRRVPALAGLAAALALGAAPAGAQDRAQRACEAIESRIDALVSFTATLCTPAGGKRPGAHSFFLVSQATVLGDAARRKVWLVVAVAAAGSVLNQDPSLAVEELSLSDSQTIARERVTWVMPAALAKELQGRHGRGEIDVDAMYAEIEKGLRQVRGGKKP
jgi:hypothetical protein